MEPSIAALPTATKLKESIRIKSGMCWMQAKPSEGV